LNTLVKNVTENLDKFELGLAAQKVQDFIWDVYCDWYIEIAKLRLNSEDAAEADSARQILVSVLVQALKLLHPFMPFITEEIYTALPGASETLMLEKWPGYEPQMDYAQEEAGFEKVMDLIKAVRTLRATWACIRQNGRRSSSRRRTKRLLRTGLRILPNSLLQTRYPLRKIHRRHRVWRGGDTHAARAFIPMMELDRPGKEQARLAKEKAQCEKLKSRLWPRSCQTRALNKAPAHIVEDMRQCTPRRRRSWRRSRNPSETWAELHWLFGEGKENERRVNDSPCPQ
ncbi:MAG: class I tRNA ligase family protein, partial [Ruthenibacterium lactatiformans]